MTPMPVAQSSQKKWIIRRRWALLAFCSGNVNAGGFLACHRFVTHVTGFATFMGVDLSNGDIKAAIGMLTVPVFFLLGAVISGYFIDVKHHSGQESRYDVVFAMIFVCLLMTWIGGATNVFGTFGSAMHIDSDFLLLALLCLASGLQNAVVTSSTGATIRTTHLTGLTTDLGIGIARIFARNAPGLNREQEKENNRVRMLLIGSFVAGSTSGAFLFHKHMYLGFALPSLIAFYILIVVLRHKRALRISSRKESQATP